MPTLIFRNHSQSADITRLGQLGETKHPQFVYLTNWIIDTNSLKLSASCKRSPREGRVELPDIIVVPYIVFCSPPEESQVRMNENDSRFEKGEGGESRVYSHHEGPVYKE